MPCEWKREQRYNADKRHHGRNHTIRYTIQDRGKCTYPTANILSEASCFSSVEVQFMQIYIYITNCKEIDNINLHGV